jgi:hypothetical protein
MPTYRFYSADLLTGNILAELPLYGTYMNREINVPGNFTGTFKLGSGRHIDTDLLDGSIPGRTAVYCERNGTLIWGGIIWSRTYAAESKTCGLTAQTFESIFDHVVLENHFIMQYVEQSTILTNMINAIQAQASNNFGLTGMGSFPTTGVKRTVLVPGYEYHFAQTVLDQIIGVDGGLEYTIDVIPSGTIDRPTKLVRAAYPKLGDIGTASTLSYDYPGTVSNYWWPESSTRGATKVATIGHGSGQTTIRATAVDGNMLAAGWPAFWQVNTYGNIKDIDGISAKARGDLNLYRMPYSRPTIELKSDIGAGFDGWNKLGSTLSVHIEDARFPNGFDTVSRMLGWELTPADSNSTESVKFTIEGKED